MNVFFRLSFRNCKSCVYNCDDQHPSFNKSRHSYSLPSLIPSAFSSSYTLRGVYLRSSFSLSLSLWLVLIFLLLRVSFSFTFFCLMDFLNANAIKDSLTSLINIWLTLLCFSICLVTIVHSFFQSERAAVCYTAVFWCRHEGRSIAWRH